jgi:pyruvate kinase
MVEQALNTIPCSGIFVPSGTGNTARMISRFKPAAGIVAICNDISVCQGLMFSYGVSPVLLEKEPENWSDFARKWLAENQIHQGVAILVAGPTSRHPGSNHRLEFFRAG